MSYILSAEERQKIQTDLRRHRKSLYVFLILSVVYLLLLLNGVRRARRAAGA
jgi:hypothetical protein